MFHHSRSPTQSIFTQSKLIRPVIFLLGLFSLSNLLDATDEWVLSGTYVNGPHRHAMFVDSSGNERLLVLDEIFQGCRLVDVFADSATLNCDGEFHEIKLRNSVGEIFKPITEQTHQTNEKFIFISKQGTQEFFTQRQRFVSEIAFLPKIEDGKMIGFTVSKVQPNSQAAEFGLNNGDIIQSVNGVSVSTPEEFFNTIRQLDQATQVHVDIDRFGQQYAYTYVLE